MDTNRAKLLIKKYTQGECTPEEKALVESWYEKQLAAQDDELAEPDYTRIEAEIWNRLPHPAKKPLQIKLWPRIAIAASVLICLSIGGYFLLQNRQTPIIASYKNDIRPGLNQATLTLANGQKIILIKGVRGKLARQGATEIGINAENNLAYIPGSSANTEEFAALNTLSTAKGEQSPFPLILPDGSKVWLNAESSITFPTAFRGKERLVNVTGEALFEVVHNAAQPFKVRTQKQTIEDIGTVFNVNSYPDEPFTTTTLVEGSVRINHLVLKPNEQTDGSHIQKVNTRTYTAWKNGDFNFQDEKIKSVMRQLSRWYNIDVAYQGAITNEGFNAEISRSKNISAVLHLLENTKGVHFKIEGRRVTVIQ